MSHPSNRSHQSTQPWPTSVSIIGAAGLVGSTVAAQLAFESRATDIYLQDRRVNLVEAHAIDINEARVVRSLHGPRLHVGPPPGEVDLVIVAASVQEDPAGDRREFIHSNIGVLADLTDTMKGQLGEKGLLLLLSNPVDILATWLWSEAGFDPRRIVGYSLNDSARFRMAVARELNVEPHRVRGHVLGEHGRGQVPAFSSLTVDGKKADLSEEQIQRINLSIDTWFANWAALKSGRSSGWTSGLGTSLFVEQLAQGLPTVGSAFSATTDTLPTAFLSLPIRFRDGAMHVQTLDVTPPEMELLKASAASILRAVEDAHSTDSL
ncbi:hypothetical protein AB0E44_13860 [Micrococcus terreus]|uniref:lactate/malate family dehydrogenase n=1 Tax=Micrococcus terreus TaxID=574650 RepID=UPI0033E8F218